MKKFFYLFSVFAIAFTSCTQDAEEFSLNENIVTNENIKKSGKRNFSEALSIAKNAVNMFDVKTRSASRTVDLNNVKYITSKKGTRAVGSDTLLYIFNYSDNSGFAVVSSNKNTEGLLALIEEGSYDPAGNNNNAGFNIYMNLAENYVATAGWELIDPSIPVIKEYKEVIDTVDNCNVEPKISVRWGQRDPEGLFAPNKVAGCSNTATAQIMSYFSYPTTLAITYSNTDINSLNLDWDAIRLHNTRHEYSSCNATDYAHDAIGNLHRQIGHLSNSSYYNDVTGTSPDNARNAFINLGYTVTNYINYSGNSLKSILDQNKVIYMCGYSNSHESGHAWVVDGYTSYNVRCTTYTRTVNSELWDILDQTEDYHEYIHINWGWYGNCNGYFFAGVFETDEAEEYDNTANAYLNSIHHDFGYDVKYFSVTH